jgi:hypothetical protein
MRRKRMRKGERERREGVRGRDILRIVKSFKRVQLEARNPTELEGSVQLTPLFLVV